MKYIITLATLLLLLSACSAKQINDNTDSIIGDTKKVFNDATKSSED